MPTLDPRVDAYLSKAPEFARPILERLRRQVHDACPEVVETMKWSRPHFLLDDRILCGMSAFKAHCAFGFWRREGSEPGQSGAMGDFGRITTVADLPEPAELSRRIQAAAALVRTGAAPASRLRRSPRPALDMPEDFATALAQMPLAMQHYQSFPPSKQRDYLEWVLEAKREDTRARRIAQSVEWLTLGRSRNWKYESC